MIAALTISLRGAAYMSGWITGRILRAILPSC